MSSVDDSNHATFLAALTASQSPVWRIASWLVGRGHAVKVNPTARAEQRSDWKKNADNGDLEISLRIEVKQLSADFTSAKNWPFGNKFIVCAKHAFDQAVPKPHAFFYVNRASTHFALVMSYSSRDWYVEKRKDSRYKGVSQEFYFAPMSTVMFSKLPADGSLPFVNTPLPDGHS